MERLRFMEQSGFQRLSMRFSFTARCIAVFIPVTTVVIECFEVEQGLYLQA